MIANLQPYQEYKDSGVPWLGTIPAQWEVRRTKLLLREVDSRSSNGKEQLLRVSQYTGVTQRKAIDGSDSPDTRAASLVGYKRVTPNDLVINIMLAWNGSMGVSRYDGIASPAYCVYRFKDGSRPWYYHELLRLPLYKGRIKTASTGVVESRLRLYSDDLGRIEAIQPPPEDQDAIVRFIDHANARLERAIRAKRKVIALLHEQKKAIIHRAVTRGLDPSVPLKPSGIAWLGDIPKHWELMRVKFTSRKISKGDTPSNLGREFVENGPVSFIKIENIGDGEIIETPVHKIDFETHRLLRRSQLQENDIVYAISGATTGKAAIIRKHHLPANTNQAVAFIRPNDRILPSYLVTWLHGAALKKAMWLQTVQSAQPNLSMEELGNLPFIVPPKTEQSDILAHLHHETSPFDTAINHLEREIELLREYRTRLVADVVTGKLDVRPAARHLPAEPVEPAATLETEELTETEPEETSDAND
jgi:type I restriction enzyme, S subunit